MPWLARLSMVAGLLGFAACTPGGAVGAALYRDLPTLKQEISRAQKAGDLDKREVERLAEAVLAREIASASGPSGVRRVRAVRACAPPVLHVLRTRSDRADDVGAEAMLVRLTQNDVSAEALVKRYRDASSGPWRAVAARASVHPGDVLSRRRQFEDPDERVRRAALEAAGIAPEKTDLPLLLEAFRLDPDPLSRSLAARAAGLIGGEEAVLGLSDRLARREVPERLAVIDAWAMPASLSAGGDRKLRQVAEGKQGIVSVAAAAALLRSAPSDGAIIGLLLMALEQGSEQEQQLAIGVLPLADARAVQALEKLSDNENLAVRVFALGRLLGVPAAKARAEKRLRELASKSEPVAVQARSLLAAAGDKSVVPALARDVERGHPSRRQSAALALFRLGEPAKAAPALGDDDPGVRVAVSCGVLATR